MRKWFLICGVLVLSLGFTWVYRFELILFAIKQKTHFDFDVGPNRPVPWQKGLDSAASGSSEKPNIIFIVLDDVGFNDISTFGGGIGGMKTPHIDALAAQSVVFQQAYAGTATCSPSRAMMMTGRYPTRTGYEFTPFPGGQRALRSLFNAMNSGLPEAYGNAPGAANDTPYTQQGLPTEEITVAEILQKQGYHTVHIGKWHLGRELGMAPNDQGFAESLLMDSGLYLPEDHPNVINAKLDFDPIDRFLWARMLYSASYNDASRQDLFEPKGYLTDYWTDESLKVIEANKNRPFFLYLAHWGVHTPLQATKEDYDAVGDIKPHRRRVYAAMMRALDRSIGRIQQKLEDTGLADNTMIVLTNDNGGANYLGLRDINAPYRGWKLTYFEGGLRVPYFIKWPSKLPAGTVIETPVSHIDIMPTLAAAAGAPLPAGVAVDGKNLLPLASGAAAFEDRALYFQSGYYTAIRHGDWKLQISEKPDQVWLYDLSVDPTEQANIAADHPDVVAKLTAMLDQHRQAAVPVRYPYSIQAPVAVDKTLADKVEPGDTYVYWPN